MSLNVSKINIKKYNFFAVIEKKLKISKMAHLYEGKINVIQRLKHFASHVNDFLEQYKNTDINLEMMIQLYSTNKLEKILDILNENQIHLTEAKKMLEQRLEDTKVTNIDKIIKSGDKILEIESEIEKNQNLQEKVIEELAVREQENALEQEKIQESDKEELQEYDKEELQEYEDALNAALQNDTYDIRIDQDNNPLENNDQNSLSNDSDFPEIEPISQTDESIVLPVIENDSFVSEEKIEEKDLNEDVSIFDEEAVSRVLTENKVDTSKNLESETNQKEENDELAKAGETTVQETDSLDIETTFQNSEKEISSIVQNAVKSAIEISQNAFTTTVNAIKAEALEQIQVANNNTKQANLRLDQVNNENEVIKSENDQLKEELKAMKLQLQQNEIEKNTLSKKYDETSKTLSSMQQMLSGLASSENTQAIQTEEVNEGPKLS